MCGDGCEAGYQELLSKRRPNEENARSLEDSFVSSLQVGQVGGWLIDVVSG